MRVLRLVATAGLMLSGLAATPLASATHVPGPEHREPAVLHRVVWDQYEKKGTHLWSANPDGSDARKIYTRPVGFVVGISLNRQGTEAAVAPITLRSKRAALVVVDVLGDHPSRNLITDHPEIYFVGGIGWSPNGRKLVFEGAIDEGAAGLREYLFTVRRDGAQLRRIASLGRITEESTNVINLTLAWTPGGILYQDLSGLELLHRGRTRLLTRVTGDMHITGDGAWVYIERRGLRRQEFWRLHPDGSGLERLYRMGQPGDGTPYVYDFAPSYDGSQTLSYLEAGGSNPQTVVVVHDATRAPSVSDPVLPFSSIGSITWN